MINDPAAWKQEALKENLAQQEKSGFLIIGTDLRIVSYNSELADEFYKGIKKPVPAEQIRAVGNRPGVA